MKKTILAATLGTALLASASAALAAGNTWYLGGNVGSSMINIDESSVNDAFRAAGATTASTSSDDRDTGYKIFAGYQFNDWLGLEFGYFDMGKFSTTTNFTVGAVPGTGKLEWKVKDGYFVDAVGTLPLANGFSLFGRLGAYSAKTELNGFAGAVRVSSASDRSSDLHWGIGAGYDFNKNVGVRLEWERFQKVGDNNTTGRGDVDLASIGIVYRFQ